MSGMLSEISKASIAITPTAGAAGTTTVNGTPVDMNGQDGVLFVVQMGTIAPGAVTSIKAQQDTVVGMGAAADIAGSGITVLDTDDDKTFLLEIIRPTKQFVRVVVVRGTAAATVSAVNLQYGAALMPVTHGANVTAKRLVGPAEGTP